MPNNETQADIIREMRDLGALDAQCNDMIPRSLQALGLRTYAGRLEAARKRETAGSAAAMRAALESISENLAMHVRCGRFVAPGDHVSFPISEAEAYIRDIRAALSAPVRNCDLCEDWLALYVNFRPPKGMREMPPDWVDAVAAFCKWLKAEGGQK